MLQTISTDTVSSSASGNILSRLDLRSVRNATLLIVSLAVLLQLTIFFSTDNLVASALLLGGLFAGLYYSLDQQLLIEYPLSTLAILGYTVSYFVIPPLGQLADFNSILHNLTHHILVWVFGFVGLLILVTAHYAYRMFLPCGIARWSITNLFFRPLRFFEMPNALQFWLMGFIGIVATIVNIRIVNGTEATTTLSSIMRVFRPLMYVPYFMVFPEFIDPRYRIRKRPLRVGLIAYTGLIIAVTAMTNSRGMMFTGFASLGVVYVYRVITGTIAPPKLTLRSSMVLLLAIWLISGPITNMAASMVVARKWRSSVSPRELAAATLSVYRSGIAVRSLEGMQYTGFQRYDEAYYGNIFLDRLGNVRYTDISLNAVQAVKSLGELPYFKKIEFEKIIAILPEPAIKALRIGIDKERVLSGSSEDFLYELATGYPIGGFKTDSPFVILSATFGFMWPVYVVLILVILFIFIDARIDIVNAHDGLGNRITRCSILNPIVAGTLFGCTSMFTAFGLQDVASYISVITRDTIETAMVYGFAFIATKGVSSLMLGWMWRTRNTSQRGA